MCMSMPLNTDQSIAYNISVTHSSVRLHTQDSTSYITHYPSTEPIFTIKGSVLVHADKQLPYLYFTRMPLTTLGQIICTYMYTVLTRMYVHLMIHTYVTSPYTHLAPILTYPHTHLVPILTYPHIHLAPILT